jgi:hypothetical protein
MGLVVTPPLLAYSLFKFVLVPLSGEEFRSLELTTAFCGALWILVLAYVDARKRLEQWLTGLDRKLDGPRGALEQ